MSKFDEIKNDVGTRGKSLLVTVADILESFNKQTLAFASDFGGFAVAQVRLPAQVSDFGDYRDRSRDNYSEFGTTVKGHGLELFDALREVPGQIKTSLTVEAPVAKPAKAPAAKKTSAAKPTVHKTTVKKAPAKTAAAKTTAAAE